MNKEKQGVTLEGRDEPGKGKHIHFISGDEEYVWPRPNHTLRSKK